MSFWSEFFTFGGQEKCFIVSIMISIRCNMTRKIFENRSADNISIAKMSF